MRAASQDPTEAGERGGPGEAGAEALRRAGGKVGEDVWRPPAPRGPTGRTALAGAERTAPGLDRAGRKGSLAGRDLRTPRDIRARCLVDVRGQRSGAGREARGVTEPSP